MPETINKPTKEQCFDWYIDFQWALAAPEDYHQGMQDTFEIGIPWLIEHGYIQLTEKGMNHKPQHHAGTYRNS